MLGCLPCEVFILYPSVRTVQMWVLESLEINRYLLTLPSTQFSWILEGMYLIGTTEGTLRAVVKWPRLLKGRDCSRLKSHSDGTTHLGENCGVVTILCMCVLPGGRIQTWLKGQTLLASFAELTTSSFLKCSLSLLFLCLLFLWLFLHIVLQMLFS